MKKRGQDMKKVLALILVVTICLLIVACDGNTNDEYKAPTTSSSTSEPEVTLSEEQIRKDEAYALAGEIYNTLRELNLMTLTEEQGKLNDLKMKIDYFQKQYQEEKELYTYIEDCYDEIERFLSNPIDDDGSVASSISIDARLSYFDAKVSLIGMKIELYEMERDIYVKYG